MGHVSVEAGRSLYEYRVSFLDVNRGFCLFLKTVLPEFFIVEIAKLLAISPKIAYNQRMYSLPPSSETCKIGGKRQFWEH